MTGIFKPDRNSLTPVDLTTWRLFYCSLCSALCREYSAGAAFLLPSDIIWLLLCLDNLNPTIPIECTHCHRCLANPFRRRPVIAIDPIFSAAADLSTLVIRLKIIDGRIDSPPASVSIPKRLLMRCAAAWIHTDENRLGITDSEIASILITDRCTSQSPDERIRPMVAWLTGLFTSRLEQASMAFAIQVVTPGTTRNLKPVATQVAAPATISQDRRFSIIIAETIRILYLIDALEDFHADLLHRRTNILSHVAVPLRLIPVYVAEQVSESVRRIRTTLTTGRHRAILINILQNVTGCRLAMAIRCFENALRYQKEDYRRHETIPTRLLCDSWSRTERFAGGHQASLPGTCPPVSSRSPQ